MQFIHSNEREWTIFNVDRCINGNKKKEFKVMKWNERENLFKIVFFVSKCMFYYTQLCNFLNFFLLPYKCEHRQQRNLYVDCTHGSLKIKFSKDFQANLSICTNETDKNIKIIFICVYIATFEIQRFIFKRYYSNSYR